MRAFRIFPPPLENLTKLEMFSNNISDISVLSSLTSLTYLDLKYNQTSDITPLSNLTSLTDLDLSWNQISDVTPFIPLAEGLTRLSIYDNPVADDTNTNWTSFEHIQDLEITNPNN